ncbi:MAG: undecaprenyldiphospho-muramoylpentapeptide beta-N-acetylglucosaminyltransferase [Pseudomonadota bacterium]
MNDVAHNDGSSEQGGRRVMIMAGGTGGHVYPALAVANWLREHRHEVVWLGTRAGIEARVVPAAGFPIEWVHVSGLRGKSLSTWLTAPVRLVRALLEAWSAVRRRRPHVVLGMGGFVTGPGGVAAWLLRIPLLVHEQNAIAGLSNRLLAHVAMQAFEAFPGSFKPARAAQLLGNPVRDDIEALAPPGERLAGRANPRRMLVLGGSLGARTLNLMVPAALALLPPERRPLVRHQSGARGLEQAQAAYAEHAVDGEVTPFIEDMAEAYGWADLVLCRAGALTIAEVTATGVAAILVPYPFAVDDHQAHNGRAMVDAGAALMVRDDAVDGPSLAKLLGELFADPQRLEQMAERSRALAYRGATRALAMACVDAAERRGVAA